MSDPRPIEVQLRGRAEALDAEVYPITRSIMERAADEIERLRQAYDWSVTRGQVWCAEIEQLRQRITVLEGTAYLNGQPAIAEQDSRRGDDQDRATGRG